MESLVRFRSQGILVKFQKTENEMFLMLKQTNLGYQILVNMGVVQLSFLLYAFLSVVF
jgi:hypothetical protein